MVKKKEKLIIGGSIIVFVVIVIGVVVLYHSLVSFGSPYEYARGGARYNFKDFGEMLSVLPDANLLSNLPEDTFVKNYDSTMGRDDYSISYMDGTDPKDYNNYLDINVCAQDIDNDVISVGVYIDFHKTAEEWMKFQYKGSEPQTMVIDGFTIYYIHDDKYAAFFENGNDVYDVELMIDDKEKMIDFLTLLITGE